MHPAGHRLQTHGLEVSVVRVYNRECACNSVRLRLEVSVMCVLIKGNEYVIGNTWFIAEWPMRLRLQVSIMRVIAKNSW